MRSTGRILTTHVGSLIRPPALVEYLRKVERHEPHDERAFAECLRASVAEVVRQQAEVGVDLVSDGEFGKTHTWSRYILERLSGFELRPYRPGEMEEQGALILSGRDRQLFRAFYAEYEATQGFGTLATGRWVCSGPLKYTGQALIQRDIANLKSALGAVGVKGGFLPVVAPASVVPERRDEYYRDEEAYIFAVADALGEEYRAIIDAGLDVQIDDAHLPFMYERMVPPATMAEYRKWAELRIEALNRALVGIPESRSRYHICWGSWNGPHVADVPLKEIVDLVLRVKVGGYSIEGANPRHEHEWRIWESVKLPPGRVLIPGLISHSTNVVEHPELVCERIVRLARLVGRENVIASTDCGFAQGPFVQRVHPTIMWAKLGALVEGAALATRTLWGKAGREGRGA